jgi:hypothetical protein
MSTVPVVENFVVIKALHQIQEICGFGYKASVGVCAVDSVLRRRRDEF